MVLWRPDTDYQPPAVLGGGAIGLAERIALISLRPGSVLSTGLFTLHGVKLLPPRAMLTDEIYRALLAMDQSEFILARDLHDLATIVDLAPSHVPPPGSVAPADLLTVGGMMALEPNQIVEQHHADALQLGAFAPAAEVQVESTSASGAAAVRTAMLGVLDEVVASRQRVWQAMPKSLPPTGEELQPEGGMRPDGLLPGQLAALRAERVTQLRWLLAMLVAGLPVDPSDPQLMVDELIDLCCRHPFRFAELAACNSSRADYLPDHLWSTCALSVGIAVRLKWPRQWARNAGLAGLFADAGMAMLPTDLRLAARPLSDEETTRVRRHVSHSVLMLDCVLGVDEQIAIAVAQHHEREDGSGYPTQTPGRGIAPLAKLVAVADTFAALTARRPHREPMLGYDAMQEMIRLTSEGQFERKYLRAMVELCGLFPVGSYVRLSDSTEALVVGADPVKVDRPVVRRIGAPDGEVISLAALEPAELFVLEGIPAPAGTGADAAAKLAA